MINRICFNTSSRTLISSGGGGGGDNRMYFFVYRSIGLQIGEGLIGGSLRYWRKTTDAPWWQFFYYFFFLTWLCHLPNAFFCHCPISAWSFFLDVHCKIMNIIEFTVIPQKNSRLANKQQTRFFHFWKRPFNSVSLRCLSASNFISSWMRLESAYSCQALRHFRRDV